MKYALLIYGADLVAETSDVEAREGWIEYARAAKEAGILLGAEQLTGTDTATSVRVRGGQPRGVRAVRLAAAVPIVLAGLARCRSRGPRD